MTIVSLLPLGCLAHHYRFMAAQSLIWHSGMAVVELLLLCSAVISKLIKGYPSVKGKTQQLVVTCIHRGSQAPKLSTVIYLFLDLFQD
jgi:hypothetical protein